jgi:GntR family transcriptional regulator
VYLPAERFPGLLASDLEHNSLYDLMTERYGTRIVRAREAVEPVLLRTREAKLLGQAPGRPALLVEGIAYDAEGRPIEFARSYVRADRTRYFVERVVVRAQAPGDDPRFTPAGDRRSERGAVPATVG